MKRMQTRGEKVPRFHMDLLILNKSSEFFDVKYTCIDYKGPVLILTILSKSDLLGPVVWQLY